MQLKNRESDEAWSGELDQFRIDLEKENVVSEQDFSRLPANYIRFRFRVQAPMLVIEGCNEFNQQVLRAEIEEQNAFVEIG